MFSTAVKRSVKREGVADLGGHGVADAFFFAALCGVWPVGVSERDPYGDARAALIGEDPEDSCVLGEEQGAVGEDADLVLGRNEKPRPDLAWNGPSVRVDRTQLVGPRPRREGATRIGPQVGLVRVDQVGDRGPVVRVGHAPVQPAPHRFGINAQPGWRHRLRVAARASRARRSGSFTVPASRNARTLPDRTRRRP